MFFFAGGSIIFIVFFFFLFYPLIKKNKYKGQTHAYLIEDDKYDDSEGGTMYCPKYYFIVANKTYICRPSGSESIRPDHSKDLVYYDPENPNDCLTEYETNRPIFQYFLILIPVPFIFIGIYFMIKNIIECCSKNNNNNYTNVETNNTSDTTPNPTPGKNDFNDDANYNNCNTSDYNYQNPNNINY